MTVKGVYDRMCEELITTTTIVSQAQFYNLWKDYYPHVTIPTVSSTCMHYTEVPDKFTISHWF